MLKNLYNKLNNMPVNKLSKQMNKQHNKLIKKQNNIK